MNCAHCKNITVCAICGKGYAEAELHRLQDINGQLLDVANHLVRWHDQLTPADIARAKAVIERARGVA